MGLRQFKLIGLLSVTLAVAAMGADWTYNYADNFSAETAKRDGRIHSLFWVDRATPPPGPYVYVGEGKLVLMGYQNQLAQMGYCFPVDSNYAQRPVKGTLTVEVSFPNTATVSQDPPGELLVSVSGDGAAWSEALPLAAGTHQIPIGSPSGTAYVRFSGTRAAIDNLQVSLSAPSATILVPDHYGTIQAAINAARDGDVIEVRRGIYQGPGNQDLQFGGKAITLRSAEGPLNTIINVAPGHRGFYFRAGEGPDTIVTGFTIRNGSVPGGRGGGIYCEFSSPTIANCIIENCNAGVGGGIGVWGGAPVITDCTISACNATYGGGIALGLAPDATITRCALENNSAPYGSGFYSSDSQAFLGGCYVTGNGMASGLGGGAYCVGTLTDVTFQNCVFASNVASRGGGIYAESTSGQRCKVIVINCTIADNVVSAQAGGVYSVNSDILVTNSIVWGNGNSPLAISNALSPSPVSYSDIQGGYLGESNLNADPLFAGPGDYHLQSRHGRYDPQFGWVEDAETSPCIDAGRLAMSAAAEPASNGGRINLGAYGASEEASKSVEHAVYHVAKTGWDGYSGLSPQQAFRTISHALEMAADGDTILVWPGVYQEELNFQNKGLTLQSAADAAILEAASSYAVSFHRAESSRSILANFVIRGSSGYAIYCDEGASPTLRNLTIVGNATGIAAYNGATPYITNCILWGNTYADLFECKAYYSDVQVDKYPQAGNLSTDPRFVDPLNGDYHLKSAYGRYVSAWDQWTATDRETSPCIDAGDPGDYFEAELEPNGDRINMGAYGGTPYASKSLVN